MHVLFSAVVALATISGSFALEKYFFNDLPGSTWAVVSILCIFIALSISHAHMRKIKRLESISEETLIQLEEIRTRRFSSLMDLVDKNMIWFYLVIVMGFIYVLQPWLGLSDE